MVSDGLGKLQRNVATHVLEIKQQVSYSISLAIGKDRLI
jgi:hypothetical protein